MEKILLYITIIMSIVTFVMFGIDKYKAVNHKWRIPESALLLASFLFGGVGGVLGMIVFHHKVRKWKFKILVPVFAVLQIIVLVYFA